MANIIKGTGAIASTDFKKVTWTGKTKGGQSCIITLNKAINLGNIDWTFADKNDTVPEVVMTAVYSNTDVASESTEEPWEVKINGEISGAGSILLGAGVFSIGSKDVALTRGGGKFTVEREFREINADSDRGPVEGRINMEGSRATLSMNVLTMLDSISELYPAIEITEE